MPIQISFPIISKLQDSYSFMASHPQLPKFGSLENEEDVVYFEKAKEARKGKANPPPSVETAQEQEEVDLRKSPTHQKRVTRQSVGSDRSLDTSPMHPHNQPNMGTERKASSLEGRSRLKQVARADESVDDGPVIPKFGGWDDSDPTSGEGYTGIFNKAREDKQNGGKSPMITTENAIFYGQNQHAANQDSKGCWCFPWSRK